MSRTPKSTAAHIADGTLRKDRHSGRVDLTWTGSGPDKPPGFDERHAARWEWLAERIPPSVLVEVDGMLLLQFCQWWARYEKASLEYDAGEGDWKAFCQLSGIQKQMTSLATQLGLSPKARASLRADGPRLGSDMMDEFKDTV